MNERALSTKKGVYVKNGSQGEKLVQHDVV